MEREEERRKEDERIARAARESAEARAREEATQAAHARLVAETATSGDGVAGKRRSLRDIEIILSKNAKCDVGTFFGSLFAAIMVFFILICAESIVQSAFDLGGDDSTAATLVGATAAVSGAGWLVFIVSRWLRSINQVIWKRRAHALEMSLRCGKANCSRCGKLSHAAV